MGLFDKLFNFGKSDEEESNDVEDTSGIRFGRYSDNNKTLTKTNQWYVAEDLYKSKKFNECIEAFFDYLRDEKEDNVKLVKDGSNYSFEIYQGTKIVHGTINDQEVKASVSLAKMEKPSIPVMRRLLEMNFSLYYARFALNEDKLCMLFDSPKEIASPNKLYYGLKELATKADKQDDLLLTDFASLQAVDDSHVAVFDKNEQAVKYHYFKKWIDDTLQQISELNQDSFSGGIAYMLLTLIYRLDFMITPEGKLLNEIERINNLYWTNKEEKTAVERNQLLKEAFRKLVAWPEEEVKKYFYRAKATFAITLPKSYNDVIESIRSSKDNMLWYRENKYEGIAHRVLEYGLSYPQYSYSLPKPVTDLYKLYMQVNHAPFFEELGINPRYIQSGKLNGERIKTSINSIILEFKDKFPKLTLDTNKLNFTNLLDFNITLMTEMETLNFDNK
jgi:hypothetical protein